MGVGRGSSVFISSFFSLDCRENDVFRIVSTGFFFTIIKLTQNPLSEKKTALEKHVFGGLFETQSLLLLKNIKLN